MLRLTQSRAMPPGVFRALSTPIDFAALRATLDVLLDGGACHAVRVDGRFGYVRTRSVPRQKKPYPAARRGRPEPADLRVRRCLGQPCGFSIPGLRSGSERRRLPPSLCRLGSEPRWARPRLSTERRRAAHRRRGRSAPGATPPGVDLPVPDTTLAKKETFDAIEGRRPEASP